MLLNYAELFRVVSIGGRYGGGKTSLAVWMARGLVGDGACQFVACNFHLKGVKLVSEFDSWDDCNRDLHDAAIIFDEAWQDLGQGASPKAVKSYLAYLRKRNLYLLLPSVLPLSAQVRVVQVERLFNGLVWGIPLWLYTYTVRTAASKPDRGRYWWWRPSRIFQWYDHTERPGDWWGVYDIREKQQSAVEGTDTVGDGGGCGGRRGVFAPVLSSSTGSASDSYDDSLHAGGGGQDGGGDSRGGQDRRPYGYTDCNITAADFDAAFDIDADSIDYAHAGADSNGKGGRGD